MKQLFNDNWYFAKYPLGTPLTVIQSSSCWQPVALPHDWLIYNTRDLYENSIGCYQKVFTVPSLNGNRISLLFEGVYMNTTLYINGKQAGKWMYGYTSFLFDITDFVHEGENTILVHSVYQSPNTRWYSGAGIYRDVYLVTTGEAHLVHDGIYITTKQEEKDWTVTIATELIYESETADSLPFLLRHTIFNAEGQTLACLDTDLILTPRSPVPISVISRHPEEYVTMNQQEWKLSNPNLWSIENPYHYTIVTELFSGSVCLDSTINPLGFRTIQLDPEKGVILNGSHVKLHGVCMHHDLGSLGSAFHLPALRRQFKSLKAMGVNAIRTSHNPPAPAFMWLADEMGFLIDSEAFDMWELPKTTYDYARYFNDWCERDVAAWIRRDRNHPCLIFWSIGNEIYDTHLEQGYATTKRLCDYVRFHDPEKNAYTTIGSNYIEWEGAQHCSTLLDASGYNYAERLYEKHHAEHPEWVIYGSETSSTVQSRNIYHFPADFRLLTHDDLQCSSLDNCTTNWGAKNTEYAIYADRDAKFALGQFIWTGWDYIGEPTPYFTKNSYFGQADTAGFEKDSYYLYQAEWTDYKKNPMIHLLPYWDFNEGQIIDIKVYSNAPEVELFFQNVSQGRMKIDHENGKVLNGHWRLPYTPGTLTAVAYDERGNAIASDTRASFGDTAELRLTPDKTELSGDGQDMIFVTIDAYDQDGIFVANARNRVQVHVQGAGRLVGLDNGDSTDYDQYKGTSRRLFGGKLLAILVSDGTSGEITVTAESPDLPTAVLHLQAIPAEPVNGVSILPENQTQTDTPTFEIPIRKIELVTESGFTLRPDSPALIVHAKVSPVNAEKQPLYWKAILKNGVECNFIKIKTDQNQATITAIGDGTFRLRCYAKNGTDHPEVVSELDFTADGFGTATLNPYDFVSAALYHDVLVEPKLSFQGGIHTEGGRNWFLFDLLDFGDYGSDEITIPIFSFDSECPLEIWEGCPDQGGKLLLSCEYRHKSEYNQYNSNTWKLPKRLRGIVRLAIQTTTRLSLKGFSFTRYEKAYALIPAVEQTQITGDMFHLEETAITGIGNNVTIEFANMDFKDKGFRTLIISGRSKLPTNTIHVCFHGTNGESKQIVEFSGCDDYMEQCFTLEPVYGEQTVLFVFLPGSNFDFKWFRFE